MIIGESIYLRPPFLADYEAWAALRTGSRDFVSPYEAEFGEPTPEAFTRNLVRWHDELAHDRAYSLFAFRKRDDALFGFLSFQGVRRGGAQSAVVEGWIGREFAGSGLAYHATVAGLRWALGPIGLHRVEASTLPSNAPSQRLLKACGFSYEGDARSYGKVNDVWRDHTLWAIVAGDQIGYARRGHG